MGISIISTLKHSSCTMDNELIEITAKMNKYDTNEKINNLKESIEKVIYSGNSLGPVLSINCDRERYIDYLTILNIAFEQEIVDKYYERIISQLYEAGIDISKESQLHSRVYEFIFNSKQQSYANFKVWHGKKYIAQKVARDITRVYENFIKNKIEECILNDKSLIEIPRNLVGNIKRVIILTRVDEEIYCAYLKNIIKNKLIENNYPMKLDEEVKYMVSEYLFGEGKKIRSVTDTGECYPEITKFNEDIMKQYYCVAKEFIYSYVELKKNLDELDRTYMTGFLKFRLFLEIEEDMVKSYLVDYAQKYYDSRKKISFTNLSADLFGIKTVGNLDTAEKKFCDTNYYELLKKYVDEIYEEQCTKLLETNKYEVKLENDIWRICYESGPKIHTKEFDFSEIRADGFRYEVKLFIMEELKEKKCKNINTLSLVTYCVNYIYDCREEANCFANIDIEDVISLFYHLQNEYITIHNKRLQPSSISKMIGKLGVITTFLMKYSKKNKFKIDTPRTNIFDGITFSNLENMSEKTEIIPEIVSEQIEKYKHELQPRFQLMLDIFQNSGIRLQDVLSLEEDCIEKSSWEHLKILKYKPGKVANIAKKHSRSGENEIIIPLEVAKSIQIQIDDTKELREQYKTKKIFIHLNSDKGYYRANLTSSNSFCKTINSLIKRHNIVDYDGNVWRMKSRQLRKTVVVTMIENGATKQEIAYALGHYNMRTLERYYADVRAKKLEEMNCEFYKNKFQITMGKECLAKFTKEERELLYIDFLSDYRKVELGYCTKHFSEGECGVRAGKSSCANCEKICTGKQFLLKWEQLRDAQQKVIDDLVELYNQKNISEEHYKEFKEYNTELYYLNLYKDVINNITR